MSLIFKFIFLGIILFKIINCVIDEIGKSLELSECFLYLLHHVCPSEKDAVEKYNGTLKCINEEKQFIVKIMFLRECRICHCSMDAGEGQNGICDDCISGETEKQRRKEEVDRMVRSTVFKQMNLEEFIR